LNQKKQLKRPTFIVENATPKIEKVVRAIPQWAESGEQENL